MMTFYILITNSSDNEPKSSEYKMNSGNISLNCLMRLMFAVLKKYKFEHNNNNIIIKLVKKTVGKRMKFQFYIFFNHSAIIFTLAS